SPKESDDFLPEDCGPTGNGKCVHATGSGWKEWGAGFGFDLNSPGEPMPRGTYDVSAFKGIAFWAKGTVPFRVSVAVQGGVAKEGGGPSPKPTMPDDADPCHNTHGKTIRVTRDWKQYV